MIGCIILFHIASLTAWQMNSSSIERVLEQIGETPPFNCHPQCALCIVRAQGKTQEFTKQILRQVSRTILFKTVANIGDQGYVFDQLASENSLTFLVAGANILFAKRGDVDVAMGKFAELTMQARSTRPAIRCPSDRLLRLAGASPCARGTDDNFASIVAAVEEGRGIYDNIRKTLQYLLAGNTGELLLMTMCMVTALLTPLLPIHLLWINLVTDGLPALCLATDRIDADVMQRPPRSHTEPMTNRSFVVAMVLTSFFTAGTAFGVYLFVLRTGDVEMARSYTFAVMVFAELLRAFGA